MSKDVAFARPDHTGGRIERLLISVAKELAQGMREPREICETHGITLAQLEVMQHVPLFQRTLEDFAKDINATASTGKRVALKAQYAAEQMLTSLFEIANDVNAPAVARVKAIELNAKIAGLLKENEGGGGGISAGVVNIDFGLMPPAALTVRKPDVMDLEAIEDSAGEVGEDRSLDDDILDLLDAKIAAGLTHDELNRGAAPVPGFDLARLHRPHGEAFTSEGMVHLNAHQPIVPREETTAETVESDLVAIQF